MNRHEYRRCYYHRICKPIKVKRTIARILCGLSALAVLLIVGGLERFWLPLWPGSMWLAISLVVFALSARKGGLLR